MNINSSPLTQALLRPGQALEMLGGRARSSRKTEYVAAAKLRELGIPIFKVGNAWKVPRSALDAWLSSPACVAAAAAAQSSKGKGKAGRPSRLQATIQAAMLAEEVRHG